MRLFIAALCVCSPAALCAESVERVATFSDSPEFQLGGAATLSALAPVDTTRTEAARLPRLSLPITATREEIVTRREGGLGAATVFVSEGLDAGRDAFELGTFLSRGQARAGLSVTYVESDTHLSRSEVFLDYSLTEQFSIGLSGVLDSDPGASEPLRQLGLNAEFATSGGAFVQGGVAGAADYDPVIGLSIGLRF